MTSRRRTIAALVLGISTPITDLPGMGASMRMVGAARHMARSWARFTMELLLTPGAGCTSNWVMTGPQFTPTTSARMP